MIIVTELTEAANNYCRLAENTDQFRNASLRTLHRAYQARFRAFRSIGLTKKEFEMYYGS